MRQVAVFWMCVGLLACGDATLQTGAEGIAESGAHHDEELMYLRDADEVAQRFAPGRARFEPSRSFRAVELMLTTEGAAPLEWRARDLGGVWSSWVPLVVDRDERFRHAVVDLPAPATAFSLRDPGGLVFARLAFQSSRGPEAAPGHEDDPVGLESPWDAPDPADDLLTKRARAGRWQPANDGGRASVRYTGAPAWQSGRNCAGGLTAGARALGEYLVDNFRGASYFQGYACRQIRGSSGMSVHGTGRAVDIFVPLSGGEADNDLGDPVGDWLIEHAEEIGVQLIIWDRTIWTGSRAPGSKARYYSGAHPHHDHLHVELTPEAAARRTPFFGGAVQPPAPAAPAGCDSATLGRRVPAGECVQMAYARCGGTCNWARCEGGAWVCAPVADCAATHGHASCAPAPAPTPDPTPTPAPQPDPPARAACESRTLGRSVAAGACVQMAYDSCGGTCRWARCDDGGWTCTDQLGTCDGAFEHAACAPAPAPAGEACWSRTLGQSVDHGGFVQMAYEACGGSCQWAVCDDGQWRCDAPSGGAPTFAHAQCR